MKFENIRFTRPVQTLPLSMWADLWKSKWKGRRSTRYACRTSCSAQLVQEDCHLYSHAQLILSQPSRHLNSRQQTPVAKRTVNQSIPSITPKTPLPTFRSTCPLSLSSSASNLSPGTRICIFSEGMPRRSFQEVSLPLKDWFADKHSGKETLYIRCFPPLIVCDFPLGFFTRRCLRCTKPDGII